MATEIVQRKRKQPRCRPNIPGRLADFVAVNAIAKLHVDDEYGNSRFMDEIEERAAELTGASPSALLQSIGLTVALCEQDVRMRHALNSPTTDNEKRQRNLDRAMRRYISAVKALAVVQRSVLPPIQINIAEQQVVSNR